MAVFTDSILMDLVYLLALAGGTGLCCWSSYFCLTRVFLINRRKTHKNPAHVSVTIVEKVEEEEEVQKGPPRQLTRQEKAKQREKEREAARLLEGGSSSEEEGSDEDAGAGAAGSVGMGAAAGAAAAHSHTGGAGLLGALFAACLEPKHQPIQPAAAKPKKQKIKKDKKKKKKKLKDEADQEAKNAAFTDLEAAMGTGLDSSSNVEEGGGGSASSKAPLVLTERQLKSQVQEKKKASRRDAKIQAEADAVAAEDARVKHEAHQAMLAAESDEQQAARKRAKEEKHTREKQEREDEAERKRALHVSEGLAAAFAKRREGALLAHTLTATLGASASSIAEGVGNSGALSLFDVDPQAQARSAVDLRLEKRFLAKIALFAEGGRDIVLDNSGPPPAVWPRGWVIDPMMPLPVCLQTMNHRKCMVLFDEGKSHGWFPGTISGVSKRKGFNYSVKFDKMETQSIEIDGVKSVSLDTEGGAAYNKGWCLLLPDPEYIPGNTRPGTTVGSQVGSRPDTTTSGAGEGVGMSGGVNTRPDTAGVGEMGASRPGTGAAGAR